MITDWERVLGGRTGAPLTARLSSCWSTPVAANLGCVQALATVSPSWASCGSCLLSWDTACPRPSSVGQAVGLM